MKQVESYTAHEQKGILLNANECWHGLDRELAEKIIAALAEIPSNRYPDTSMHALLCAYAQYAGLKEENLLAGNGSDQMLGYLIGTYLGKGKVLFTLEPDFSMYDYYASSYEADVRKYRTEPDGTWDVQDFINTAKEQNAAMIMFSNPNNPTGGYIPDEKVLAIVQACSDIPVVIDEAYIEFSGEKSVSAYCEQYDNLFVTRTLSKAFGIAAARVGFLCGKASVMEELKRDFVPYALNAYSQTIGRIVLENSEKAAETVKEIMAERDRMYDLLKTFPDLTVLESHANFLYCRSEKRSELLEALQKKGIVIRSYRDETSFRITIGNKEENGQVAAVLKEVFQ